MNSFTSNYLNLFEEINKYSKNKPKVIVVTKSQNNNNILQIINAGHKEFGENYVDEALKKINYLSKYNLEWHFIGRLQSNKIKKICQNFHWIQTLSDEKHANIINDECRKINKKINICIQINIDKEETKSGIYIDDLENFIDTIKNLKNLNVRGLMALPSKSNTLKQMSNSYSILRLAFDMYSNKVNTFDTLSLGMSNDFKIALEHGSNMLRIGQYIFGERS
ncbi:MAG: YggS family pyridoxal phosphate-dependent enzyme [Gammaproteobacteria bacterium]|nr:YggS family pyridoxal phosphate-dependent enzyme [Gammaproteobacteria bacterium]|tara:strand:- start:638 stop:1303 length:666 start_codon:yes stop_codon:yes gene_type:complete